MGKDRDFLFRFSIKTPYFEQKLFVVAVIQFNKGQDLVPISVQVFGPNGKELSSKRYKRVYEYVKLKVLDKISVQSLNMQ